MREKNILLYPFILMEMFLILTYSCKKEGNPVLTTTVVIYITQTTATCGGKITSDGGATVTARGVCWGINQTPTIADNRTTDSTGKGSFISIITGLAANTTYYERAYATNSAGTGYGSAVSFTTPGTVTDIDGNVYNTVVIGMQVWMVENLKTTRYCNGDPIQNITVSTLWNSSLTTGAYCNYNNDISYADTYGHLYNWYAVSDSRNIAPTGWHIPSDAEWTTLTSFLGGEPVAGGKLKEAGTTHWTSPNTGATNETGFMALPGGRCNYGFFELVTDYLYSWSSTELNTSYAWYKALDYNDTYASRYPLQKTYGFSVRCIKD